MWQVAASIVGRAHQEHGHGAPTDKRVTGDDVTYGGRSGRRRHPATPGGRGADTASSWATPATTALRRSWTAAEEGGRGLSSAASAGKRRHDGPQRRRRAARPAAGKVYGHRAAGLADGAPPRVGPRRRAGTQYGKEGTRRWLCGSPARLGASPRRWGPGRVPAAGRRIQAERAARHHLPGRQRPRPLPWCDTQPEPDDVQWHADVCTAAVPGQAPADVAPALRASLHAKQERLIAGVATALYA